MESVQLLKLIDIEPGCAFSSKHFNKDEGLPLIRIRDLGKGHTETRFSGPYDERYIVRRNDILVSMDGTFRAHLWNGENGLLNQRVLRVRSSTEDLDEMYLFHVLTKDLSLLERMKGQTTVKHLAPSDFEYLDIPLAPLLEQRAIAGVLSALDDAIEKNEQQRERIESIMKWWLDKTFEDGKLDIVDNVSDSISYGFTASSSSNGNVKFLRITDLHEGEVNWDGVPYCTVSNDQYESNKLLVGDIVFARTGATTGKSYMIESLPDDAVPASYLIRIRPRIESQYLYAFFQSRAYWRQIEAQAGGSTQPGVNASKLGAVKIPRNSSEKERKVGEQYFEYRALIRKIIERAKYLQTLKQGLLHELLSGERRVLP
jgi:type I restriction enzyme, S subunit